MNLMLKAVKTIDSKNDEENTDKYPKTARYL